MEIRLARPEEFHGIVRLVNRVFGIDRDMEWFSHFHLENPSGKSVLSVAVNDGEVLSYRSIVYTRASCGQTEYLLGQLADASTAPECRGQGLYGKVQRLAIQEFAKAGGQLLYAFPGPMNYPILTRKFGFTDFGGFWQCLCPISRSLRLPGVPKSLVSAITAAHSRLFGSAENCQISVRRLPDPSLSLNFRQKESEMSPSRDVAYMKWRFSIPGRMYTAAILDESNFLILGEASRHQVKLCTIVDYNYETHEGLAALLKWLRGWAGSQGYDAIYSWAIDNPFKTLGLGLIPLPRRTHFLVRPSDQAEPRDRCKWNLNLIDTDAY